MPLVLQLMMILVGVVICMAPAVAGEGSTKEGEGESTELPQVGLLFEWIEIEKHQASKLLAEHRDKPNANLLREALEKSLDDGKADLVETSYVLTRSGQKAVSESVLEFRYGTENGPEELSFVPNPQRPPKRKRPPGTPKVPTAIDHRDVGTLIGVEPDLEEGGIQLKCELEIVRHTGSHDQEEKAQTFPQPKFHVMNATSDISLRTGQHALLSVLTPASSEDKRVLVFVRASVLH